MVVEDEILIAQYLKMELEDIGYEVCNIINTAKKAINSANEESPDLILMDIHLGIGMDGISAAKEIIAHNKIPIIFMTGYTEIELMEQTKEINPAGYLDKPIRMHTLIPLLDSIFK